MKNELIPITVYVKPSIAEGGIYCLFDVAGPPRKDQSTSSMSFYEVIERYPLDKYEWNLRYAAQYVNCDYSNSTEKQLCKLLTKE